MTTATTPQPATSGRDPGGPPPAGRRVLVRRVPAAVAQVLPGPALVVGYAPAPVAR
ncbi:MULTISPECIES: hypothetical protein [Pseudonocardia]|uniref:Uncharacterized protein n=2 Tax=Pseudonocardia TaxID=1847 RepID=A0A1Y2N6K4_PSEAH|nr:MULTISPECIES: hypothetical protein [Pseudonocardia]OSY43083.1 hypothetical protein BG845_00688 [Pseudonocardia autotrophica]TDN71571.1 hypothetical protein C8E95_0605 [Pseudonocardia autotrophica]GEC23404.1 hypothetical protein PSA01_04330 [Pseudonocardia saturnea]